MGEIPSYIKIKNNEPDWGFISLDGSIKVPRNDPFMAKYTW